MTQAPHPSKVTHLPPSLTVLTRPDPGQAKDPATVTLDYLTHGHSQHKKVSKKWVGNLKGCFQFTNRFISSYHILDLRNTLARRNKYA